MARGVGRATWGEGVDMLITNIILSLILFMLIIIFGALVDIKTKLGSEEVERMQRFYKSLLESIKKKGTVNKL